MAKRCRFHLRIGWLKGHRLSPKRKDVGIFQRMLVFGIYFHDLDRDLLKIPKKACRVQHSFQEGKGVMSLLATNLSPSRLKTPFPWWIRTASSRGGKRDHNRSCPTWPACRPGMVGSSNTASAMNWTKKSEQPPREKLLCCLCCHTFWLLIDVDGRTPALFLPFISFC